MSVVESGLQKIEGSFTTTFTIPVICDCGRFECCDHLCSPEYVLGSSNWYVAISIHHQDFSCQVECSCYDKLSVNFSVIIIDHYYEQERIILNEGGIIFDGETNKSWDVSISWEDIKNCYRGYYFDGTLTMLTKISMYDIKEPEKTPIQANQTILKELSNMFSDATLTDITIIACPKALTEKADTPIPALIGSCKRKHVSMESTVEGDQAEVRISAHKFILTMRSPVFRTMFASGMVEARTNEVHIQDFDAAVVKEFLRFLYTDQCDIEPYVEQLLAMACMYQVKALQGFCVDYLCSTLSATNVANILQVSDQNNTESLKKRALQYITENAKKVVATEGFCQSLTVEQCQDVMRALAGLTK